MAPSWSPPPQTWVSSLTLSSGERVLLVPLVERGRAALGQLLNALPLLERILGDS